MITSKHVFWAAVAVAIGLMLWHGAGLPAFVGGFLGAWIAFFLWAKVFNWSNKKSG